MEVYGLLRERFGFLDWWPGDTADEVFIGAILTQQTSWTNVEKAMANLKAAGLVSVAGLANANVRRIESMVRPSGYYRQKAARLKSICASVMDGHGSLDALLSLDARNLRDTLLALNGIGNETADSIVLYAADKPSFVIDAYTKREIGRIYYGREREMGYDELKGRFEAEIAEDLELYKDMHAQFVELGKNYCRKSDPECGGCPLAGVCRYGIAAR